MITSFIFALALSVQDAPSAADTASEPEVVAESADSFDTDVALARVNEALNGLGTLQARFTQIAPDGTASEGTLSLRRPGRLRFEYAAPSPLLIVADGTTVAIHDTALETTDRAPIRATPLWWILKDEINLAEDARVLDVWTEHGFVYVSLTDSDDEMEGEAVFLFDAETYALNQWFVVDALGQTTRILLDSVETDITLNARLFVLDDAEDERRNRRR